MQVELPVKGNPYVLQQHLSEMVWKDLSPKLSTLFDRFSGENEVIRLDKIELDLGEINIDLPDYESISNKIIQLLEEKLKDFSPFSSLKNESKFNRAFPQEVRQSTRDYLFQLWLYWLEKGVLPPYTIKPEGDWMSQVLETLGLEHRAVSALAKTVQQNAYALKRLILQHKEQDLKAITELFTGFSQKGLVLFFGEFRQFMEHFINKNAFPEMNYREWELQSWQLIFTEVILNSKKLDSKALIVQILLALPENILFRLQKIAKNDLKTYTELDYSLGLIENRQKNANTISISKIKENAPKKMRVEDKMVQDKQEMESPQFFKNAGLVLLHPFFHRFFEKLELIEDKKFRDLSSQGRAVRLMQFLCWGEKNSMEYEMQLPKLLCAMPSNLPMDHTVILTNDEKEEANSLLEAVIKNWGALGSTSADGLREGFLIRDGILKKNGPGWKLIVEGKTIDILLDRLPWGISMLKLPWMNEVLNVEWR